MDARLGDRDCLLLHCLVDRGLVLDVHLIEFINAANAMISEHKRTRFDAELPSLGVLQHISRQTGRTRGFTATVDGSRQELADVLEELRLGCGWVANDADVDIASQLDVVDRVLPDSSEELE